MEALTVTLEAPTTLYLGLSTPQSCWGGQQEVVAALLEAGADMEEQDNKVL